MLYEKLLPFSNTTDVVSSAASAHRTKLQHRMRMASQFFSNFIPLIGLISLIHFLSHTHPNPFPNRLTVFSHEKLNK